MKMSIHIPQLQSKIVGYYVFLRETQAKKPHVSNLSAIISAVILILITLRKELNTLSAEPHRDRIQGFFDIMLGTSPIESIARALQYSLSVIYILCFCCLAYFISKEINLASLQRKNKIVKLVTELPGYAIILTELMYFNIVCYLYQDLTRIPKGNQLAAACSILNLGILLTITLLDFHIRLYSKFLAAVVLFMKLVPSTDFSILLLVLTILMLVHNRNNIHHVIYGLLLTVLGFKMIIVISESRSYSDYLYLGCAFLLTVVGLGTKLLDSITIGDDLSNNRRLFEIVRSCEVVDGQFVLDTKELLFVDMVFKEFYQQNKATVQNEEIDMALNLSFQGMFIEAFDNKLEIDFRNNNEDDEQRAIRYEMRLHFMHKVEGLMPEICYYLMDLEQKQHKKMPELVKLKRLQLLVYQNYIEDKNPDYGIRQIIKCCEKKELFIQKCLEIYEDISSFWYCISQSVIEEQEVEEIVWQQSTKLQECQQTINEIRNVCRVQFEDSLYQNLKKMLSPGAKNTVYGQSKEGAMTIISKIESLIYFIMKDNTIARASYQFNKIIHDFTGGMENGAYETIVPQQICGLSEEQYRTLCYDKKLSMTFPLITRPHFIKVYTAQVALIPACTTGIEYFYHLIETQAEEQLAYVYYSSVDFKVKYINKQFLNLLRLNQEAILKNIKRQELHFNDMLEKTEDQLSFNEQLTKKKSVGCVFNIGNLMKTRQGMVSSNQSGIVTLKSVYKDYFLVQVQLDYVRKETQRKKQTQKSYDQLLFQKKLKMVTVFSEKALQGKKIKQYDSSEIDESHSKQQEEGNDIFCRIKNPFSPKIEEKKTEIGDKQLTFCTYSNLVLVLVFLLIAQIIVTPRLIFSFINEQAVFSSNCAEIEKRSTQQIMSVMHANGEILLLYFYGRHYPIMKSFFQQSPYALRNYDFVGIIDAKISHINKILYNFKLQYVDFSQKNENTASFSLQFEGFTLDTNLALNSLTDYCYNLELSLNLISEKLQKYRTKGEPFQFKGNFSDNPLYFSIVNYPTLSQLQTPFNQIGKSEQKYNDRINKFFILVGSLIGFYLIVLALIWFYIFHNLKVISTLLHCYTIIPIEDVNQKIKQIESLINKLQGSVSPDFKKLICQVKAIKKAQQYQKKAFKSNKQLELTKAKQDDPLLEKHRQVYQKKSNFTKAFCYLAGTLLISFIFLILLGLIMYGIQRNALSNVQSLKFSSQLQFLKLKRLRILNDLLYSKVLNDELGIPTEPRIQMVNKQSSVSRNVSAYILEEFTPYFDKEDYLLKESLCRDAEMEEQILTKILKCNLIALAVMEQGFVQTLEFFDVFSASNERGFPGFIEPFAGVYPNILTLAYTQSRLDRQIQFMKQALQATIGSINHEFNRYASYIQISCYGITFFIILYTLVWFRRRVFGLKSLACAYFQLLPSKTIQRIEVSRYIFDQKILNKISAL